VPPTAYSYADVLTTPVAINGNAVCGAGTLGLVRTFNITDSFTIGSLQVGLRLAHPYRSDLSARLRSPSSTEVTLFSFAKNVLAENVNALFTNQSLARLPDDLFSHDLEAGWAMRAYRPQNSLSAFAGQNAAGTWTLTLCDSDPANDTGAFYAAALDFAAVAPPLNVTGNWNHRFDASGSDGQTYSWQLYATDVNGNRTAQPYNLTVQVDNVPPVITATQTVTRALIPNGGEILRGVVTDGDVVSSTWLLVMDPLGNSTVESVAGDATAWTYTFTPTLGGEYKFTVYAADRAGNQAGVGTFSLTALQPLDLQQTVTPQYNVAAGSSVAYTFWIANYNANEAANNVIMTSTLSRWLTPVNTAGATFIEALPDNLLVWPPMSLAAGADISFTVLARMPNELVITDTLPITQWVDLRGALFASLASLTTDNLGPSQAYACHFVAGSIQNQKIYLPLVMRNYAAAPDLVVQRILATSNNVQVVIKNQGSLPVKDEFWVDVYINPTSPPTHVNQTWDMLGDQGLTWGVTGAALPALTPGGALTLTVGDAYYWPSYSQVSWPLAAGTPVYAQVDSVNWDTTYGAVLESHEIMGGDYNNIGMQAASVTGVREAPEVLPSAWTDPTPSSGNLPRRP
jgi:subtilisin-like proprotein convertase family protein